MKTRLSSRSVSRVAALSALFVLPGIAQAQNWRLVGVTGQQADSTPDGQGGFLYPDHTLYGINLTTAAITKLFKMTFVTDSHAIGFCPADGRLYHTAGSHSWTNRLDRTGHAQGGPDFAGAGYLDCQYFESVNVATQAATALFNCNPCPNPDAALPCFGLPAPRPSWVLPVERRDSTQNDESFRVRGTDEYTAVRGMAWSAAKNLFYIADDEGIFKLTRTGECTFLARPAFPSGGALNESKGIAFVKIGNETRLLVGHRNGVGDLGQLMEIDPETGNVLDEIALTYPPGGGSPENQFGGLLGIEQHPDTGVLYGVRKTSNNFARELVSINPVTGTTALVGGLGMHVAGITFIQTAPSPRFEITTVTRSGNDVTMTWTGGTGPYQIQSSPTMTAGSWTNVGGPTSEKSATVTVTGPPPLFLHVKGQ